MTSYENTRITKSVFINVKNMFIIRLADQVNDVMQKLKSQENK